MKKLLAIILCILSSTAFVYSIITCQSFLYSIVFIYLGLLMLVGLFIIRKGIRVGKRLWANVLLAINLLVAIGAIGSLYYIYNKDDGKIAYSITDNKILDEVEILVAEYRQTNHVNIEGADIHAEMYIAYESTFDVINDRSKIRVNPKLYNFIISINGYNVVDLFDWRNEKYRFDKSYIELTTIRNNNDGTPVYTTGYKEFVDSVTTLPDIVTFHISNRQTAKYMDSLVFIKNKVYNNVSTKKNSEEYIIKRKRTLIQKIKDLYLIG